MGDVCVSTVVSRPTKISLLVVLKHFCSLDFLLYKHSKRVHLSIPDLLLHSDVEQNQTVNSFCADAAF